VVAVSDFITPGYSLAALIRYYVYLGSLGFGGPVALVGFMHRDLVERRRWISEDDYKTGLALAQLAPGPLAAQLAIYMGYVHYGVTGATLVGAAFVLPSFLMVVGIGWAYQTYGGLAGMQAAFYGVAPCVIGIIAVSSYRLTLRTIGRDRLRIGIFLAMAVTTFITETEIVWLMMAAGVVSWWIRKRPTLPISSAWSTVPIFLNVPSVGDSVLLKIAVFFGMAGAFVFGSGLAIVPFLYGGVVHEYGWLDERQFLDAVAVAMITPGPVVITVGFIGYLVSGFSGACVAALATFLPCYLFTVIPAPYFKKYGSHAGIKAFVDGVTAAAIGAIAGAVLVLARRSLTDGPTVVIALTAVLFAFRFTRIREPCLIAVSAGVGWMIKGGS
jgi:chromate transporter